MLFPSEDTAYTFTTGDFGFSDTSDSPPNTLAGVIITRSEERRVGKECRTPVTATQENTTTDITAGNLKFYPAANANGANYASFNFKVRDNGGTANGGVDTDQTANSITLNATYEIAT